MKKYILLVLPLFVFGGCEIPSHISEKDPVSMSSKDQHANLKIEAGTKLVFTSPSNGSTDVKGKTPITFLWDKPIFMLQNPEKTQKFLASNITITPEIEGAWQILGTTGVLFEPKNDWKRSTRYEFTLSEDVLGQSMTYAFETPRLSLENVEAQDLIFKKSLVVHFNQPIDLDEAQKVWVTPALHFDIQYRTITETDSHGQETQTKDRSTLEFVPKTDWSEDTTFTFTIPVGMKGSEGDLTNQQEQQKNFKSVPPFRINHKSLPNDVFESLSGNFTTPVLLKDLLEHITLTPAAPEAWQHYLEKQKKELQSRGAEYKSKYFNFRPLGDHWIPQQEQTFTITKGLQDEYGRVWSEDHVFSFTPEFPDRLQPMFFPYEAKSYQHGTNPKYSWWYSGTIQQPKIAFERAFPNPQRATKPLSWPASPTKREIVEIDLTEDFPEMISEEGLLPAGWYTLRLSWLKNGNQRERVTSFAITDFLVEIKKTANQTLEVFPTAFPETTVSEGSFLLSTYTEKWESNQRVYRLMEQIEDVHLPVTIPTDQYRVAVLLQNDGHVGIGSTVFQNGIRPYDAPISFGPHQYQEKITGVVFPDRPLFRPGDKVYFKSIYRERQFFEKVFPLKDIDPEQKYKYRVNIRDSKHNQVFTQEYETTGGSLDGAWEMPPDASLGNYQLQIAFLHPEENRVLSSVQANFYVTEYRKPNFLIDASFDTKRAIWKDQIKQNISAEYAFGGALAGKKVDYTVSLLGQEKSHWYWQPGQKKDHLVSKGKTFLDEEGRLELSLPLDLELDKEIDWNLLNLDVSIENSPREKSAKTVSIPFFLSEEKITLQAGSYFYQSQNETIPIKGILTDLDDQPQKKKLTAQLFQQKWVRNDRKGSDGKYVGEWEKVEPLISEQKIYSSKRGHFEGFFTRPEEAGNYFIRMTSEDDEDRIAQAEQHFWVWTDQHAAFNLRQNEKNKILPLYTNFDDYLVGNDVNILFPHNAWPISRAHVTIERGTVLETIEADLSKNVATFPAEAWMAPNVFVSILIEGVDSQGTPQVRWGALKVSIKDPQHELDITLHTDKPEYEPQETLQLNLNTQIHGKPVSGEVAIAVVDQTLLALKSRPDLDLWKKFLSELPLGVETFHTLANFMSENDLQEIYDQVEQVRAANESPFGGGGGDESKGGEFKPRGDFRDTAAFFAKVQTDANGEALVDIPLPDNLTTWHIWTVGHTQGNAFGEAETTVKTALPLLISPIVPNFFRAGDLTEVGVLIRRNQDDPKKEKIKVTITLPEAIETLETEQIVKVTDEARVFFPVTIPDTPTTFPHEGQTIVFRLDVESESGLHDAIELERKIFPPLTTTSAATFLDVKDPTQLTFKTDERARQSTLVVKTFGTLLDRLQKFITMAHLGNYFSSEQRLSYWSSRLIQAQLFPSIGKEYDPIDREVLEKERDFILNSQDPSGGFKFWPGAWRAHEWLTSQVLEWAPLWAEFDVPFPEKSLQSARAWLGKQVHRSCGSSRWGCMKDATRQQAAFLFLKAPETDHVEKKSLEFLLSYTRSIEAKVWWLRSAYLFPNTELSPQVKAKKALYTEEIKRLIKARDRYFFWEETEPTFYSQNERLTAIVFEWLQENQILDSKNSKIARYLTDTKALLSGNTALRVLKALKTYVVTAAPDNFPVAFTVKTETENIISGTLESAADHVRREKRVAPESTETLTLSAAENNAYYADIELQEVFAAEDLSPINKGFWIERAYFELDDTDFETPVTNLEIGKNYVARIQGATNANHSQVVIEDSIPTGVEGVHFALENEDQRLKKHQKTEPDPIDCRGWCHPLVEHQEFYYDKVRFFIPDMPAGAFELQYVLRARLKGTYEVWPVKVEEMYYPEVFATGEGKQVVIQ